MLLQNGLKISDQSCRVVLMPLCDVPAKSFIINLYKRSYRIFSIFFRLLFQIKIMHTLNVYKKEILYAIEYIRKLIQHYKRIFSSTYSTQTQGLQYQKISIQTWFLKFLQSTIYALLFISVLDQRTKKCEIIKCKIKCFK